MTDNTATLKSKGNAAAAGSALELVDCDVHGCTNSVADLLPYLPDVWQHYVRESGYKGPAGSWYPKVKPMAARDDAHPPSGRIPGSDLAFLQEQHLDHWGIDRAVVTPLYPADYMPNVDFGAALCTAHNDYMIEKWYEADARLYGSIVVPWRDAELAIREIERIGDHPKVKQILLFACTGQLYGERHFHPIWQAAERHGLVIGIHWGGTEPTRAAGAMPTYYLEHHVNLAQAAMAHIVSFVCQGVFTKCPNLRVAIIEAGIAWVPSLMWRLDKDWRGCRMEVPWVKEPPSEYIKRHIRFTTQPIEEPENPQHLLQTIEHMGSDRMLMFATDYPHWDFDSPAKALPRQLPEPLRQRIRSLNAIEFYELT
jgi:predicted TIM-barrel fold metal-dependent hydrolase